MFGRGPPTPFAASCIVGREDKLKNEQESNVPSRLKNNTAAGYQTGGDNSNKRCLSNTRSQLKSSRKFGSSSRILGIHSRMSRFFSALSRNYRMFPGKISKCPDSRRNLQIPGTILALSRNSVC